MWKTKIQINYSIRDKEILGILLKGYKFGKMVGGSDWKKWGRGEIKTS